MPKRVDDKAFIKEYPLDDHPVFKAMSGDRLASVIEASQEEFAKGFGFASTDRIAIDAGVSKGLLFHYFGSKRGLFLFTLKYALGRLQAEYAKETFSTGDFMDNIEKNAYFAVDLTFRYQKMYAFLTKAYGALAEIFPEGVPTDIPRVSQEVLHRILEESDYTRFRSDIDLGRARNIICWTMTSFTQDLLVYGVDIKEQQAHYEQSLHELKEYLKILRLVFYDTEAR